MAVAGIDHVNIDTALPDETVAFYTEVLGLEHRPEQRPAGLPPGAWLFSGDRAVVHVNFHDPGSETAERLATRQRSAFNHVAFEGADFERTRNRLDELGVAYRVSEQPSIALKQLFIRDPNNIAIEINIRE